MKKKCSIHSEIFFERNSPIFLQIFIFWIWDAEIFFTSETFSSRWIQFFFALVVFVNFLINETKYFLNLGWPVDQNYQVVVNLPGWLRLPLLTRWGLNHNRCSIMSCVLLLLVSVKSLVCWQSQRLQYTNFPQCGYPDSSTLFLYKSDTIVHANEEDDSNQSPSTIRVYYIKFLATHINQFNVRTNWQSSLGTFQLMSSSPNISLGWKKVAMMCHRRFQQSRQSVKIP